VAEPLVDQFMDAIYALVRRVAPQLAVDVEIVRPQVDHLAAAVILGAQGALTVGIITDTARTVGGVLGGAIGAALGTTAGGPLGLALITPAATGIGLFIGATLGGTLTDIARQFLASQVPAQAH
jgi:hypothetical protein